MSDPTIYDVAKEAGVSVATVSRVINNYPYVKKETRAKVLKLLEKNRYVLNENARSLATQSSRMIGILIPDLRTGQHTDGVYYVEQELSKVGYSSLIYNTSPDPVKQAYYIQLLSQRKIDAVVMMGSIYQNEKVKEAIDKYIPNTPVMMCNGYMEGTNIYGILSDERGGVKDCVKLLVSKGRKNLAFISNGPTPSNQQKYEGFKDGCREYLDKKGYYCETSTSNKEVAIVTRALLEKHRDVDAIVFSEDYLALIGLHELCALGLKVPEQISIVGINNSKYSEISVPALTTLDNMLYEEALAAVRNLIQVLSGEHVAEKMIICSKVIERETT